MSILDKKWNRDLLITLVWTYGYVLVCHKLWRVDRPKS